jgi:hypothetical protein
LGWNPLDLKARSIYCGKRESEGDPVPSARRLPYVLHIPELDCHLLLYNAAKFRAVTEDPAQFLARTGPEYALILDAKWQNLRF